jgi:SAM-dependent methyltransferase
VARAGPAVARIDPEREQRLAKSGYDRPGFAARYDASRPHPPPALGDLLTALAGVSRPRLVVDLGCGSGLSTRYWAERADRVLGIEPQDAMREFAAEATQASNVSYSGRFAHDTGLEDGCADIVTAAQSLQWMEPEPTFAEVGRILRRGGIFCAYEYIHLQTPLWEPERVWAELIETKRRLREEHGLENRVYPVSAERLQESGVFAEVRELPLHSVEEGDGRRLVELALSEGSLVTLLESGVTEEEVGLDRLRDVAREMPLVPWWIGYRVWIGRR